MKRGAQTPEELETMLEDAFVVRDSELLVELFEPHALLAADRANEVRGRSEIGRFAGALWAGGHILLAQPRRVLQAGDTALVLAQRATSVVRRDGDGGWRYAISLLDTGEHNISNSKGPTHG
jgi:ketosteroid isomerase-like protein